MMKKINDKTKVIVAFLLLAFLGVIADITEESVLENGAITRGEIGGEEKELLLQLDMENLLEGYEYTLEIPPANPSKEEADESFGKAVSIIDVQFQNIEDKVPVQEAYLDGVVEAEWSFEPYGVIDANGNIYEGKVEEKTLMQASVSLSCGTYEKIYQFSFWLNPPKLSEKELVLKELETWVIEEGKKEGVREFSLPEKLKGTPVRWSEKKEYITPKILLLELVSVMLLLVVTKRKKKEDEKKKQMEMEYDYPDVVNQLALLLGAGMTIRQAFERIGVQYSFKRREKLVPEKAVYEAILRMSRRILEGEGERLSYKRFTEEVPSPSYRKLMRILLGNLEQGTKGICGRLEEECRLAFEQRLLLAKKRGEEASTKMLAPLMFMLMLVMGIVMIPALISFQI